MFASLKPELVVLNVGEDEIGSKKTYAQIDALEEFYAGKDALVFSLSGRDRDGDLAAGAGRGRGLPRRPGHRGAGHEPGHPRGLRAARPDLVPHRRRGRGPGLDHPQGDTPRSRPPARSTPTSNAASSAPRRSATTISSPPAPWPRRRSWERCGWRARNTSSQDGDIVNFRFNV